MTIQPYHYESFITQKQCQELGELVADIDINRRELVERLQTEMQALLKTREDVLTAIDPKHQDKLREIAPNGVITKIHSKTVNYLSAVSHQELEDLDLNINLQMLTKIDFRLNMITNVFRLILPPSTVKEIDSNFAFARYNENYKVDLSIWQKKIQEYKDELPEQASKANATIAGFEQDVFLANKDKCTTLQGIESFYKFEERALLIDESKPKKLTSIREVLDDKLAYIDVSQGDTDLGLRKAKIRDLIFDANLFATMKKSNIERFKNLQKEIDQYLTLKNKFLSGRKYKVMKQFKGEVTTLIQKLQETENQEQYNELVKASAKKFASLQQSLENHHKHNIFGYKRTTFNESSALHSFLYAKSITERIIPSEQVKEAPALDIFQANKLKETMQEAIEKALSQTSVYLEKKESIQKKTKKPQSIKYYEKKLAIIKNYQEELKEIKATLENKDFTNTPSKIFSIFEDLNGTNKYYDSRFSAVHKSKKMHLGLSSTSKIFAQLSKSLSERIVRPVKKESMVIK